MRRIELFLDERRLGTVKVDRVRGRETWVFAYDADYLDASNPMIDPSIANVRGPQFPRGANGFGFLADVAPDRWGRKLIRKREKRELAESDFILGVCDLTRQGALRLKLDPEGAFEAPETDDAAPPWTTLRRLEDSARHLDADDRGADEERWLQDLFRPGTSLGGARPKANVTAPDGSLWIAKFPSARDERDVGRLEYETSVLARKVGLNVPETKCQRLSKNGTTFFSRRFDRVGARRIHYASAMTMLGASDGEDGHSYLEIAAWLVQNGAAPEADLRELWGRMAFSQLVGNTDDHLRNHGFLLTERGWRLSPMFDVNPNPDGGEPALDRGDLFKDADCYRLTEVQAREWYAAMRTVVEAGGRMDEKGRSWYNDR